MKTEDLKKQGLTDEQIQFVFAENGKDISALQTENATLKAEKATLENEKKVLEKEKTEKDKTIQDYQKNSITKDEYNKQVKEIEDNAKREREEYIFNGILSKALDDNKVLSDEKTRKAFETLLDKDTLKISDDQKSIIGLKEQLDTLKDEINISGKSVHEILTVASILQVELSGNSKTDDSYKDNLKKIAQVIYKRINSNDTVGSDVTCYYGVRKKLSEELTINDILDYNPYNTRLTDGRMNGKLPIGPISNPYIEAIDAVIHPSDTNYYFFVSNTCTGEMFFEESYVDFLNKVYELQSVCSSN